MNKKAISPVIGSVILIVIVIAAGVSVWIFTENLIEDEIDDTSACFNIFEKVKLNDRYTCYNTNSNKLDLSLEVGDVDLEELIIVISGDRKSETIKIEEEDKVISSFYPYGKSNGDKVSLPTENSGETYTLEVLERGFSGKPDAIEVYPVIDGTKCEKSDSINEIESCFSLAN
jgi:flagellin-like protein